MTLIITEDEITFPRIIARDVFVSTRFEQGADLRHILVREGNVEVVVRTRLFTEQRIHAPAAINEDFDIVLIKKLHERNNIVRGHFGMIL